MLIKKSADIRPSEITSRRLYLNRREFIRAAMGIGSAAGLAAAGMALPSVAYAGTKLQNVRKSALSTSGEELTPLKDVTTYNNYYEFGTGKTDPSETAHKLHPNPWSVSIEGE
jgi:sulfoxide reductase catalytic subunit YedY